MHNQSEQIQFFDEAALERALNTGKNPISAFKAAIKDSQEKIISLFENDAPIEQLIWGRSKTVDFILTRAWQLKISNHEPRDVALLAVGGYGRGELHPGSDVDILILLQGDCFEKYQESISSYITFLWDIGLEIGSSVRTLTECVEEAKKDITIATNIVESRIIYGPDELYEELSNSTGPDQIWPSKRFFEAKWKEQIARHKRFHDTAYNLEPNVKESPGGLRDIHMIGWVAKRHFGELNLHKLVDYNFLTEAELQDLLDIQNFLWKVRFLLHMITGRREDRLLFEYQRTIADKLNFNDENQQKKFNKPTDRAANGNRLAVELFMKQYYRNVMELNRLNEMLLQYYQETILIGEQTKRIYVINKRFQVNNGFLQVTSKEVFKQYPFALLELFLLMQGNLQLRGVRASTIRLIRENLHLIDDNFRNDLRCKSLFIEIFKQSSGLTNVLRRMNTYGILAAYIPKFGKIVGQMQFDLFHVYTVDQHTLFLVRNLRRFFISSYQHEFPLCSEIIKEIPKPELLYIAGVFHDIGKGRGGDHSVLGEVDAREFCQHHGLSKTDTELVAWLVRNHLIMSATAQNKDLSDPDVIFEFAEKVENNIRLDYLYLLTVADMRATNSKIWNSWKDSLLKTLRRQTKIAFQRGFDDPLQEAEKIEQTKKITQTKLEHLGFDTKRIALLWEKVGSEFFIRYSSQEVLTYSQELLKNDKEETFIYIERNGFSGGTDIFLKTPIKKNLFCNASAALDKLGLNIVEAKIASSRDGNALNTYSVLEMDGKTVNTKALVNRIRHTLLDFIDSDENRNDQKMSNTSRRVECFIKPSTITFANNESTSRTTVEVITTDRRGLLALIAEVFMNENVRVSNAKISTLGAQVDDIFYVRDGVSGQCITDLQKESIKTSLSQLLDCQ